MTEISTEKKLAFQDGIRAAIDKLDGYAMEQIMSGDAAGYHAANEMIAKLRGDIEYGLEAPTIDYETRLKVTEDVFRAVVDHASDGGSYRGLIYGRLGFQTDAYAPLLTAGGMTISNEFSILEPGTEHDALLERFDAFLKGVPVGADRSMLVEFHSLARGLIAALSGEQEKRQRMREEIEDLVRNGIAAESVKGSAQAGRVMVSAGGVGAGHGGGGAPGTASAGGGTGGAGAGGPSRGAGGPGRRA